MIKLALPGFILCSNGMRKHLGIAAVSMSMLLAACGTGGSQNAISRSVASTKAIAAIVELDRYHAQSTSTAPVAGYAVVSAVLTSQTASVPDGEGHMLSVAPAPSRAWVVTISAPPQGIWGSISAIAEVDSSSGVVVGTGLWAVPANAPVKGG
jgi:hypothetical protein